MLTFTYNQENSVIIKNIIILNIIHNIFNLHETEVVICIILVLFKRADDHKHYLNINIQDLDLVKIRSLLLLILFCLISAWEMQH